MTPTDLLRRTTAELDTIRTHISLLDGARARGDLVINAAYEFAISMSYIRISSALESFHNALIETLLDAIAAESLPLNMIRRTLQGVALQSEMQKSNGNSLAAHRRRAAIFRTSETSDTCTFGQSSRPTDDKTIRSEHYDTLWEIFGFPGAGLPSSTHIAILNEIADFRNKLVHGRMPYSAFARLKSSRDILEVVTRVDEIVLHVCTIIDGYLTSAGYRR